MFVGKNLRDQHFSTVSKTLKTAIHRNQEGFKCAADVVNILNSSFQYLYNEKFDSGKISCNSKAVYFNPPEKEIINKSKRIIQDLHCYYNLQNIQSNTEDTEFGLYSTLFSDRSILTPGDSTIDSIPNITFINKQKLSENKIININNESRRNIIQNNIVNKRKRIYYISSISKNNLRNNLTSELATTSKNGMVKCLNLKNLKNLKFIFILKTTCNIYLFRVQSLMAKAFKYLALLYLPQLLNFAFITVRIARLYKIIPYRI